MKSLPLVVAGLAALCWWGTGCASVDANPKAARSDRGYVDLYSRPQMDLWWKVDVFNPDQQDFKEFTAQFEAPQHHIFRIEARPGKYRARIAFLNQAIEAPAEVDVEVVAGMISPVRVNLEEGSTSFTRTVEDRLSGVRRKQVTDAPQQLYRIQATAEPARPYTPKEMTRY